MEGIGIIIIIIVIGIISSVARKKKPKKSDEREAPVRPPTVSDIQKAFQLMTDFDRQEPSWQKETRPAQNQFEGTMSSEGTQGRTEGTASSEGTWGRTEGAVSSEGTWGQVEGAASSEGTRSRFTSSLAMDSQRSHMTPEIQRQYTSIKTDQYISEEDNEMLLKTKRAAKINLTLFEDQNDYVKAIIYSEILKSPREHSRR